MTAPAAPRNAEEQLVRLLLRWYYGYHKAVDAHKADAGDAAIKPHFLSVYRDTDDLLSAMRQAGTITDQQCHETFEQAMTSNKASGDAPKNEQAPRPRGRTAGPPKGRTP
jgi:hypothetical protein